MLQINLNSKILNESTPVVPSEPAPVVADRGGKVDAYWRGFNRCIAGEQLEAMNSREERNGWWWCIDRQSESEYFPAKSVNWGQS